MAVRTLKNQGAAAIKESGSNVASTNLPISVTVPGVHLTLERGAVWPMKVSSSLPRATSTENSGQLGHDNHLCRAAAQE